MAATADETKPVLADPHGSAPTSRLVVGMIVAVLAVMVGYFALGMPGMDHSATSDGTPDAGMAGMPGMDDSQASFETLSVSEFEARAASPTAIVVNVHTPYDGEIAGTDLFIPYDGIAGDAELPENRDAELLLYCRTGTMSDTAARALAEAGYRQVAHLDGGMVQWAASGRPLQN
jgi:rhodanese-related sulfurtransferase